MQKQFLFLAKFFIIFALLQALILHANLSFVEQSLALLEAKILGLESFGNKVFVNGEIFSIDANCTGLLSAAIVAAIVFSLSKPGFEKKILIFLCCAVLLFLLNIPRLFLALWAAKEFGATAAETVHVVTWFSTAALILLFWYFLTKKIANVKDFSRLL